VARRLKVGFSDQLFSRESTIAIQQTGNQDLIFHITGQYFWTNQCLCIKQYNGALQQLTSGHVADEK